MATIKQGQLTAAKECARHLRPFLKRVFWKAERRAAKRDALPDVG
jgi:hypothetical protein